MEFVFMIQWHRLVFLCQSKRMRTHIQRYMPLHTRAFRIYALTLRSLILFICAVLFHAIILCSCLIATSYGNPLWFGLIGLIKLWIITIFCYNHIHVIIYNGIGWPTGGITVNLLVDNIVALFYKTVLKTIIFALMMLWAFFHHSIYDHFCDAEVRPYISFDPTSWAFLPEKYGFMIDA